MKTYHVLLEAIKIIGQIGVFSIAVYWIHKLIDLAGNKKLEEHKSALSSFQAKQSSLHTKRFAIIETLYNKLVKVESCMQSLMHPAAYAGNFIENEARLTTRATNSFREFNIFFEKNKIYFTENTCELINNIRNEFCQAIANYHEHAIFRTKSPENRELMIIAHQNLMQSYEAIKEKIPPIRAELEQEFRKILVVS